MDPNITVTINLTVIAMMYRVFQQLAVQTAAQTRTRPYAAHFSDVIGVTAALECLVSTFTIALLRPYPGRPLPQSDVVWLCVASFTTTLALFQALYAAFFVYLVVVFRRQ